MCSNDRLVKECMLFIMKNIKPLWKMNKIKMEVVFHIN